MHKSKKIGAIMEQSKKSVFIGIIISILLISCSSDPQPQPPKSLVATSSPTSTQTQNLTPQTNTPSPTATPIPTIAPSPAPSFTLLETTFRQSGKWNLAHPFSDPNLDSTIQKTSDGYRLDPTFFPDTIELSYQWGGMGDPILDYQRIERNGYDYWKGNTQVSTKSIRDLVNSISGLHPEPQLLQSITHTDDYPKWTIDVKDTAGNHILIYTDSNGQDYVPWNVVFNGQIFAKFDGQLADTVSNLFKVSLGQPAASTGMGNSQEGYISVNSNGWPGQLTDGYTGLLAIQTGFHYWTDPLQGELQGFLKGRSSINGSGNMIFGSITELTKIEVDIEKGQSVSCILKSIPIEDPEAHEWLFTCPIGSPDQSGAFRYPIRVTFSTDKGRSYTQEGELFGAWDQRMLIPVMQAPEEIEAILETSAALKDLMTDHQVLVYEFSAEADPVKGTLDHKWDATVVLLGQLKTRALVIPYTVTTRVVITDSKLTQWDLDRKELNALISDVLGQTITNRFLDGNPDNVLNLYYEEGKVSEFNARMYLWACADLPTSSGLPSELQPLRGFAFNQQWGFYGMQIAMMDGKLRLMSLDVDPSSEEDSTWYYLLPQELKPADLPAFENINIYGWAPFVNASWVSNSSQAEIEKYTILAQSLPGIKEIHSWGFQLEQTAFTFREDGGLALVSCGGPKK